MNYSYESPKNKYPQYTRKDFELLTYAQTWSRHRNYLLENEPHKAQEILEAFKRNPMYRHER